VKIIKAADNINKCKSNINKRLLKLLERLDLDRPLMLREKLDILWKEESVDATTDLKKSVVLTSENSPKKH
jgi:hypothetical protein